MRGQTNKFFKKKFFCPESQKCQNVSNGVEQASLHFSKIVGRVSEKNETYLGGVKQTIFFKQIFRSGKSIKSKRIKRGRTKKFSIFQKLSVE